MNSRTTIAQVLLLLLFYVQPFDNKRIDITSNNEIITVHIVVCYFILFMKKNFLNYFYSPTLIVILGGCDQLM